MKTKILGLAILLMTTAGHASIYEYHPNSIIHTGGGFNPYQPDKVYDNCVQHEGLVPLDEAQNGSNTAARTTVMIETLKSKKDFYSKISFSAQIQGSYSFYSGSASVNMLDERAFHSDSLSWIILFKTDYGKFGLKNPVLKPEIAAMNPQEILKRCGPEIAVQERRGVMTYAVMTLKNLNEKKRYEFSQNFSAGASGGIWNANMKASYEKILRSAMSATDFSVRVYAIGGLGVTDITDLLGSGEDEFVKYKQIPSVMKDYISHQSVSHSVPTQYATRDLETFIPNIPNHGLAFKSQALKDIYDIWDGLRSKYFRLESLLYGSDRDNYDMDIDQESKFLSQYREYREAMNVVFNAGESCFKTDGSCTVPNYTISPIKWPAHSKFYRMCEANRDSALNSGKVPYEFYLMAKRRNLGFLIENGEVVGQEDCNEMFY
ncbi:MAG: hypothetical protein KDD50_10255 [Bdellovibrionales bacterium]|nr:hypothetical protein [Bdellovibrionales bacterium]